MFIHLRLHTHRTLCKLSPLVKNEGDTPCTAHFNGLHLESAAFASVQAGGLVDGDFSVYQHDGHPLVGWGYARPSSGV